MSACVWVRTPTTTAPGQAYEDRQRKATHYDPDEYHYDDDDYTNTPRRRDLHRQDTRQRRLTYVPHWDLHRNDKYDDDDDCVDGLPVCDLYRKDKYVRTTTRTMLTMAAIGK